MSWRRKSASFNTQRGDCRHQLRTELSQTEEPMYVIFKVSEIFRYHVCRQGFLQDLLRSRRSQLHLSTEQ